MAWTAGRAADHRTVTVLWLAALVVCSANILPERSVLHPPGPSGSADAARIAKMGPSPAREPSEPSVEGRSSSVVSAPASCPLSMSSAVGCRPPGPPTHPGIPLTASWRNISSTLNVSPSLRSYAQSMAFDPFDGYTVLFGGVGSSGFPTNDTWAFENGSWMLLHPAVSPPAREHSALAWDATDGYLVLFGGIGSTTYLNDTWAFIHGNWSQLSPRAAPSPRWAEGLVWDVHDGYLLLFGGCQSYVELNDTWTFLSGSWKQLATSSAPPGRGDAAIAYDPSSISVIVFGGEATSGGIYNDTWSFTNGIWGELHPAVSPADRMAPSAAYFPAVQGIVLYGGLSNKGALYSDTWWFRDGGWTNESRQVSPGMRDLAGLAPGSGCECMLLFGGAGSRLFANGTWEYYVLNLTAAVSPPQGEAPLDVTFTSTLTDAPIQSFVNWTFSDGSSAKGDAVMHDFAEPGVYIVGVNATDAAGTTSTATISVVVDPTLELLAVAAPTNGTAPLAVSLSATAAGGAPPYVYLWSVGNGVVGQGALVNYTFVLPGVYSVSVRLTDQLNYTLSKSFTIDVISPSLSTLAVLVATNVSEGPAALAVGFGSSIAGGTPPYSSNWTFGNGASSSLPSPSEVFSTPGLYTVHLSVVDSKNDTGVATSEIRVWAPLKVNATVSYPVGSTGRAPLFLNFTGAVAGGLAPVTLVWEFGDGVGAVGATVSHAYVAAGQFALTLEGIDSAGAKSLSHANVTVSPAITGTPHQNGSTTGLTSVEELEYLSIGLATGILVAAIVSWSLRRRRRNGPTPPGGSLQS